MPATLLLIDQDVAYFRNAQTASPFKVHTSRAVKMRELIGLVSPRLSIRC